MFSTECSAFYTIYLSWDKIISSCTEQSPNLSKKAVNWASANETSVLWLPYTINLG